MQKIIVDTNFLLMQFEYGVDVPSELLRISSGPISIIICSGTMDELQTLSGRTGRRAIAARFALQNFEKFKQRFNVEIVKSEGKVDDWIIKYAQKNKIHAATNDVDLRQRLSLLGVKAIVMKSKAKLEYA